MSDNIGDPATPLPRFTFVPDTELDAGVSRADPNVPTRLYLRYASWCFENNQPNKAISILEAGRKAHPAYIPIISKLGGFYRDAGRYRQAIDTLEAGYRISSRDEMINLELGLSHYENGNKAKAGNYLRNAIALAPSDPRMRAALVNFLLDQGRLVDAERQLDQFGEHVAGNSKVLRRAKARLFVCRGEFRDGEEIYHGILADNHIKIKTIAELGIVMAIQREWDIARLLLEGVQSSLPTNLHVQHALATAQQGHEHPERSERRARHLLLHEHVTARCG